MFGISDDTDVKKEFFTLMDLIQKKKKLYKMIVNIMNADNINNLDYSCTYTVKELHHCKKIISFLTYIRTSSTY